MKGKTGGIHLKSHLDIVCPTLQWTFQFAKWKVSDSHVTLTLIGVYRPPNSAGLDFLEEFTDWIAEPLVNDSILVIMGDFSFHGNNPNDDVANFTDTITALGLVQHVSGPTYHSNNTLDFIFTEYISDIRVHKCNLSAFISDHCFIECSTSIEKAEIAQKNITHRPKASTMRGCLMKSLSTGI